MANDDFKVKKGLEVAGDATIQGDLTVNGTTTTIDSATLEVEDANITVNKDGDQSSADTQDAGITVEMSDATDAKVGYDSSTASKFKAGEVGSESEIVTVSHTQTMTGKTLTSPSLTTPTVDVQNLTEQSSTPSSPSSGTKKFYAKDDGKVYTLDSTGDEVEVGSGAGGGGINYLIDGDAESVNAASSWTAYATASANIRPVDFGGTPSGNLALTRTTTASEVLRGDASFKLAKSGTANIQGEGFYYEFSPDNADLAAAMQTILEASTSAAYADGDIRIYVVSSGDSFSADINVIEPAPTELLAGMGKGTFEWQSDAADTDIRICVHIASTLTTNWDVFFEVKTGPSVYNYGVPASDWTPFTPVWGGLGTPTNVDAKYRQVGDSIDISIKATSGTTTGAIGYVEFPNSLSASDGYFEVDTSSQNFGRWTLNTATANNRKSGAMLLTTANRNRLGFANIEYAPGVNPFTELTGNSAIGNSNYFTIEVRGIKIKGWSSNTQMSDSASQRVVEAIASGNATGTVASTLGASGALTFPTIENDTHGSWSGNTYTVRSSGFFEFSGKMQVNATITGGNYASTGIYVGGTLKIEAGYDRPDGAASVFSIPINGDHYLNAGDQVTLRVASNATSPVIAGGTTANRFTIKKVQGPSQIAASEVVKARYSSNASQTIGTNSTTILDFEDQSWDSHGSVTTGAAWKWTAERSGNPAVKACIILNAGADFNGSSEFVHLTLYKNGSLYSTLDSTRPNGSENFVQLTGSDDVDVVKGDTLSIRIFQNSGVSKDLGVNSNDNYVSIKMDGGVA